MADQPSAPSGTVTFLFTDVEGSTRLWEEYPAEMEVALERHDEILRSAISSFGGYVFSTAGDAFAAAFGRVGEAVECALTAQEVLGAEPWPDVTPIGVRMGLHTGEAQERDGDYFGSALNRAARLMSAGHGGQVLVSDAAAGLVGRDDLMDLGFHGLKDLSAPQRVWQLGRGEFAPIRTLEAARHNLPAQPTSFVGRSDEVAEVASAIREHRLVTLTGVGGVGKTRLALQVAGQLEADFPGGVWMVGLADVGDPASVAAAVATELGVTPLPEVSLTESIAQNLADRRCLLLLDNCEHLLDAAAELVEAVLAGGSAPRVVATSREGLRVEGEHVWSVPSLDVSSGVDSAAVELFVERARAVDHTFSLSLDDAPAVTEICRRLDGIPLAIELAAARMVVMTPGDVRDRLHDRFRLLAGGRRGLERHQTLRHTVQWSFELLDKDERAVLESCSVCAGGFDLPTAVQVAGAEQYDEYQMLDLLESLARKSLLLVDRTAPEARYAMLETVRQFGEEQLAAKGRADQCRNRHAEHFARGAEIAFDTYASPEQPAAFRWYDTETANLRAAFRWAADRQNLDSAATIAGKIAQTAVSARSFEPISWCEELLDAAQTQHHHLLAYLYAGAALCGYAGRPADSLRYAETGRGLRAEPQYERVPHELDAIGLLIGYVFCGQPEKWITLARENLDNPHDTFKTFTTGLVWVLASIGEYDEAVRLASERLSEVEDTGHRGAQGFALQAYGKAFAIADPPKAINALRRSVQAARNAGDRLFEMVCQLELAGMEATHDDPLEALKSFDDIIDSFDDIGSPAHLGTAFGYLAVLLGRIDRYEPAATLIGAATRHPLASASATAWTETVEELRLHLGDEAHSRCLSAGEAMELSHATTYAHEQIHLARHQLLDRST